MLLETSKTRGVGVKIDPSLCLYNPESVYRAIKNHRSIKRWLAFIGDRYNPPRNKILLIYPCSAVKPYDKSPSYQRLLKMLSYTQLDRFVHLVTISEPFGLVPQEFYSRRFTWYDCPGLFRWWCSKHQQPYQSHYLDKSIGILSSVIARFLERTTKGEYYHSSIGFVRTMTSSLERRPDHTHYRMLLDASKIAGVDLEILPDKNSVKEIVRKRGRLAWDYYGVSHPIALKHLKKRLSVMLQGSSC